VQVRECAFSDFADPAGGAARINNIGITHGVSPEKYDLARYERFLAMHCCRGSQKK
jgi:hypothetical protein